MLKIGLLEDDQDQAELIKYWLEDFGYSVETFASGSEFVREIPDHGFDLLILDWMVPDMSGMEALRWLRRNLDWSLPVLFATARDNEEDVVAALQAGADDYMTKPLKQHELIARVQAVARRTGLEPKQNDVIEVTPYRVDTRRREVYKNKEKLNLTKREFELAVFLFENLGRVLSRTQLLREVWGLNEAVHTRTVDTHMSRVRNKLQLEEQEGWRLNSVYHHGYRLEHFN